MIRFIVVDDDVSEVKHIKKLLEEEVKEAMEILTFKAANARLNDEINNGDIRKVYILDIELGDNVGGIEIAKKIRYVDYESEIIFITNHDKMFECAHKSIYEVFAFLVKFDNFDYKFKMVIRDILKRNFDNKMFHYKGLNGAELSIYYKAILYIYTDERKVVIVTNYRKYKVNLTLKAMLELLDDRFKQCYKSCIINVNHVQEKNYNEGYFVLDTGEKIYMLSKKFRRELCEL